MRRCLSSIVQYCSKFIFSNNVFWHIFWSADLQFFSNILIFNILSFQIIIIHHINIWLSIFYIFLAIFIVLFKLSKTFCVYNCLIFNFLKETLKICLKIFLKMFGSLKYSPYICINKLRKAHRGTGWVLDLERRPEFFRDFQKRFFDILTQAAWSRCRTSKGSR